MTSKDFFFLVADMRRAQKAYFRLKDKSALIQSKILERDVDREINRVRQILGYGEEI